MPIVQSLSIFSKHTHGLWDINDAHESLSTCTLYLRDTYISSTLLNTTGVGYARPPSLQLKEGCCFFLLLTCCFLALFYIFCIKHDKEMYLQYSLWSEHILSVILHNWEMSSTFSHLPMLCVSSNIRDILVLLCPLLLQMGPKSVEDWQSYLALFMEMWSPWKSSFLLQEQILMFLLWQIVWWSKFHHLSLQVLSTI